MPTFKRRRIQIHGSHLVRPTKPDKSPSATHPFVAHAPSLGNQALQRMAQSCPVFPSYCPFGGACHTCPARVQTKLTVDEPGDQYEQEADRVAEEVMRMPEPRIQRACPECEEEKEKVQTKPLADQITPLVQRQVKPEEEEEKEESVQTKLTSDMQVQQQATEPEEEEEEPVQAKAVPGRPPIVTPSVQSQINALRGGGQPLPTVVRKFFKPRFGYDFGTVRIHTDARAAETARALNARAFTVGSDIVFGAGQCAPGTLEGKRLLGHELAHVIQQQGAALMSKGIGTPKLTLKNRESTSFVQRSHLSINSAVSEFKARISRPQLLRKGQFYWSYELQSKLKTQYEAILNASWSGAKKLTLSNDFDSLLNFCYDPRGHTSAIRALRNKTKRLLKRSGNPTAPRLKRILGDGTYRTKKRGEGLFRTFWTHYKRTNTLPDLSRYAKFDMLEGLSLFENIACWSVAERAPGIIVSQGGFSVGARSPGKKITNTPLCQHVRRNMMRLSSPPLSCPPGHSLRGDVVFYRSNLGSTINKIKDALDDGYMIHARVLSGKTVGPIPSCGGEIHSIVIIGYDSDKFVFWDPDASRSNEFGGGFGFLHYDTSANGFTTARNGTDIIVDDSRGDHCGRAQYRYQVLRVWSK